MTEPISVKMMRQMANFKPSNPKVKIMVCGEHNGDDIIKEATPPIFFSLLFKPSISGMVAHEHPGNNAPSKEAFIMGPSPL